MPKLKTTGDDVSRPKPKYRGAAFMNSDALSAANDVSNVAEMYRPEAREMFYKLVLDEIEILREENNDA